SVPSTLVDSEVLLATAAAVAPAGATAALSMAGAAGPGAEAPGAALAGEAPVPLPPAGEAASASARVVARTRVGSRNPVMSENYVIDGRGSTFFTTGHSLCPVHSFTGSGACYGRGALSKIVIPWLLTAETGSAVISSVLPADR